MKIFPTKVPELDVARGRLPLDQKRRVRDQGGEWHCLGHAHLFQFLLHADRVSCCACRGGGGSVIARRLARSYRKHKGRHGILAHGRPYLGAALSSDMFSATTRRSLYIAWALLVVLSFGSPLCRVGHLSELARCGGDGGDDARLANGPHHPYAISGTARSAQMVARVRRGPDWALLVDAGALPCPPPSLSGARHWLRSRRASSRSRRKSWRNAWRRPG